MHFCEEKINFFFSRFAGAFCAFHVFDDAVWFLRASNVLSDHAVSLACVHNELVTYDVLNLALDNKVHKIAFEGVS